MQFVFNLFNHNDLGQRSLHDVIGIMSHQLMALGHKPAWDRNNRRLVKSGDGYNIIIEGFTAGPGGSIECIADAHANGARFIYIATEEPTEKGFNHGTQREMIMRQGTFVEAARYCSGILHLVPGEHVTRWFSQHAPTAQAELGYARTLIRPFDTKEPVFDFGFFGSLSKRRLKILKTLARRIGTQHAVRVVADFATQEARDEAMRTARVVVQLRKFEQMGLVSSSRCNTALSVGRPVLAEPHELSKPWDSIVYFADSLEDFYAKAIAFRGAWRGIHETQFCRFREQLSPEFCIGQPLRDIGILPGGSRVAAA